MIALWTAIPVLNITRFDVWAVIILTLLIVLAIKACKFTWPDPTKLASYASIANTQGGMIMILFWLFISVFAITTVFCVWALVRGIDPQNGIVILLTGLFSGAIGAVSGALFTAMKGGEPKPPVTSSVVVSEAPHPPAV